MRESDTQPLSLLPSLFSPLLALLLLLGPAMSQRAAGSELDARHMKRLGFVRFRGHWTTKAAVEQFRKSLPGLTVTNERKDRVAVRLDRGPVGWVAPKETMSFVLRPGTRLLRFATRAGRGERHTIEAARGHNASVTLIERGKGPSVQPRFLAEAIKSGARTVSNRYARVRLHRGKVVSAKLSKSHTTSGAFALGVGKRRIAFDPSTWALLAGFYITGTKGSLYLSDRLGTTIIQDMRSQRALCAQALKLLTPAESRFVAVAAETLTRMREKKVLPHAARLLAAAQPDCRRAAAAAYAEFGQTQHLPLLRRARNAEKHARVTQAMDEAIRRLELRGKMRQLEQQLREGTQRQQFAALAALRQAGPDADTGVFIRTLQTSECPALREIAVDALGRSPGEGVVAARTAALTDKSAGVRKKAADALAALRSPSAAPKLGEVCFDPDPGVRAAAVAALGALSLARAVPALIDRLGDESKWVRRAAADALHHITGQTSQFQFDGDPKARSAVIEQWKDWWETGAALTPVATPDEPF